MRKYPGSNKQTSTITLKLDDTGDDIAETYLDEDMGLEMLEIGELVSNLRHGAREASRVLLSAPLDRPPNNNITKLLPLDRDIPTGI